MTEELETTLDQLEKEVLETIENPYSTYRVEFPYSCSLTIPDDGHVTRITIDSRSEMVRYGRNEHDIELQMELDKEHGKPTYAKHLLKWVGDRIGFINPTEVEVSYGDSHIIEPMTGEDIDEFRDRCLNDE